MKVRSLGILSIVAAMGVAASAQAQVPDLGVNVGVFMPASGELRDAFGNSVFRFGLGSVGAQRTGNFRIGTQLDFITANRGGNRLFMAPFTFNIEQSLTQDDMATVKPYVKAFAGLAYIDYGITRGGVRYDSKVVRPTYGAEFGVVLTDRVRLSARYNAFPRTGGFDFNGLTLSATISVLR